MKTISLFLLLFIPLCLDAQKNDWRTWTSTAGSKLEAKLIHSTHDTVTLQRRDGSQLTLPTSQLIPADRAFVAAQNPNPQATAPTGSTRIEGIDAQPGKISGPIACKKNGTWHYHLYLPKAFHNGRSWPICFVMSPSGGKGGKALQRYIQAAEQLGCLLALSVESKNKFTNSEYAMNAMLEHAFDHLPIRKGLAFSSGMSGGSRMAYLMAEQNREIGGVLACGSGQGVYADQLANWRDAKLRSSVYVYSLIGTNCFNRTGGSKSHDDFPQHYRLRFFPGNHVWAKASYIHEGLARILGEALIHYEDKDRTPLRNDYAQTMLNWAQKQQSNTPWESHYWASFLKDFPSNPSLKTQASSLQRDLESNPQVQQAIAAEKAITHFRKKYLDVFYTEDGKANKKRQQEAQKLAAQYSEIPHSKIIKLLGDPCKLPKKK